MQNAMTTASQASRDEWARVNDLLPWQDAPAWARFAVQHCGAWFWLQKPPASALHDELQVRGKHEPIEPAPRILTSERLFMRPRPSVAVDSGVARLLQANVPVLIAARCTHSDDPEREALLIYGKLLDLGVAKYGADFEQIMREALE